MSALLCFIVAAAPMKIGVTLHPYYSWTARVTEGLPVELVPVVPGDVDIGSYQPRPQDVATLTTLDVLVENGLGHDAFLDEMVRAAGNETLTRIKLNEGTPLLKSHPGAAPNSHTFLSMGNAALQAYTLARALAQLRPEWRPALERNAAAFAKRLRAMRANTVSALSGVKQRRVITVHDGYAYLLQELGLEVAGVVEPAHGLLPSASELGDVVQLLKARQVSVVFSEETFPSAMAKVLEEAGARVVVVSHIATGAFTPERFEVELQRNLDAIVQVMTR
ncbi:MAG: zinc ABC transporter substrate-binding protein [Myxococcales bacterium]|nr:zinc ABC transporter substrate-binding protein [Myxococcales bacterium]MDP3499996.1 zinc ABC transporter substrate-binding protein [Myxococcales bacterium]